MDPPNTLWLAKQVATFQCPSDTSAGRIWGSATGKGFSRSNYAACYGKSYRYPLGVQMPQNGSPTRPVGDLENGGPFRFEVGRRRKKFLDGMSKTVLASEVRSGLVDLFQYPTDGRGNWGFAFNGPLYLHHETPNSSAPDEMRAEVCDPANPTFRQVGPCTIVPAYAGDPDVVQRDTARSYHPGGVNVLFGDGHVQFYPDEINLAVWQSLATIAGGEVVTEP
jgi:prepilin-type processing-associated H-X9-DG protein